jgi:hypothetical protein
MNSATSFRRSPSEDKCWSLGSVRSACGGLLSEALTNTFEIAFMVRRRILYFHREVRRLDAVSPDKRNYCASPQPVLGCVIFRGLCDQAAAASQARDIRSVAFGISIVLYNEINVVDLRNRRQEGSPFHSIGTHLRSLSFASVFEIVQSVAVLIL